MGQGSVIGAGTVLHGSVEGEGSLEIFGRVEGDVTMTGDVSVGEGGAVLGHISAAKISVQGAVKGDLRGSESVLLERGARVVGDLTAPRIGVGSGALVRGNVRTEGESAFAPNRRAPVTGALKPPAFAAKPAAAIEAKHLPAVAADHGGERFEPAPIALARPQDAKAERRPPPPQLPALGKSAKARKKNRDS